MHAQWKLWPQHQGSVHATEICVLLMQQRPQNLRLQQCYCQDLKTLPPMRCPQQLLLNYCHCGDQHEIQLHSAMGGYLIWMPQPLGCLQLPTSQLLSPLQLLRLTQLAGMPCSWPQTQTLHADSQHHLFHAWRVVAHAHLYPLQTRVAVC